MSSSSQSSQKGRGKYFPEVFAGLCSGFSVCPLNVVVDKSVIKYTDGQGNLWSLAGQTLAAIVRSPGTFLASFSFRWMYFVYGPTYIASNLANHINLTTQVSQPLQKLAIVFLVNTTCSLIKDKKYAVRYGTSTGRPFTPTSYGLFFIRDIIAMASAFTIPPILGKVITKKIEVSPENGERIAQLICPLMVQFIATPIHLLSLDIYNRPGKVLADRVKYIRGIFKNALMIRMLRFLPAYGFGGIINTELLRYLKGEAKSQ